MSFVFNPPTPTPAPPKPPPQPKPATKKRKTPPVMSEKEVKNLLYSEMGRGGSLSEATRKYLRCVENCYVRYGDGAPEKEPRIPNRRSISYNRKREKWVVWNNQNKKLKRCLTRCKNEWYRAVVNLIGDYNYRLNKDVLSHILTMVVKPRAKKKSAKKKSAKKGGRKTRRKKGTRRKRKTRKGKTRKRKRRK
jgi:hypothetical protein